MEPVPDLSKNPMTAPRFQQPISQRPRPAQPVSYLVPNKKDSRRTIGPIPPRGKDGLYVVDSTDPDDRRIYNPGAAIPEHATKGLRLFEIDLYPEPKAQVYAKDEDHAVKVYKQEFGITRFGEFDPQVSEVK